MKKGFRMPLLSMRFSARALLSMLFIMLVPGSIVAQDWKHEIRLSVGAPCYRMGEGEHIDFHVDHDWGFEEQTCVFEAAYYRQLCRWVDVGAAVSYFEWSCNCYDMNIVGKNVDNNSYHQMLSIMPSAKLCWVRNQRFNMYSRVSGGLGINNQTTWLPDRKRKVYSEFEWSMVFLGFDFGKRRVRGFFELPLGKQSQWLAGGVTVRF